MGFFGADVDVHLPQDTRDTMRDVANTLSNGLASVSSTAPILAGAVNNGVAEIGSVGRDLVTVTQDMAGTGQQAVIGLQSFNTNYARTNDIMQSFQEDIAGARQQAATGLQNFNDNYARTNDIMQSFQEDTHDLAQRFQNIDLEAQRSLGQVRSTLTDFSDGSRRVAVQVGQAATSAGKAATYVAYGAAGYAAVRAVQAASNAYQQATESGEERDYVRNARSAGLESATLQNDEWRRAARKEAISLMRAPVYETLLWIFEEKIASTEDKTYAEILIAVDDSSTVSNVKRVIESVLKPAVPTGVTVIWTVVLVKNSQMELENIERRLLEVEVNSWRAEKRYNTILVEAFFSTVKAQTEYGADRIPIERIPPLTSKYIIFHTDYTGNTSRHIISSSLIFTTYETTIAGQQRRILDSIIQKTDQATLYRMFPELHIAASGEDFRKWRPLVDHNPGATAASGLGVTGVLQGGAAAAKGAGLCKLASGVCLGVVGGSLVVFAAGGIITGGVYLYCKRGANHVYLFDTRGPVQDISIKHKQHLKEIHGWTIGEAKKMTPDRR